MANSINLSLDVGKLYDDPACYNNTVMFMQSTFLNEMVFPCMFSLPMSNSISYDPNQVSVSVSSQTINNKHHRFFEAFNRIIGEWGEIASPRNTVQENSPVHLSYIGTKDTKVRSVLIDIGGRRDEYGSWYNTITSRKTSAESMLADMVISFGKKIQRLFFAGLYESIWYDDKSFLISEAPGGVTIDASSTGLTRAVIRRISDQIRERSIDFASAATHDYVLFADAASFAELRADIETVSNQTAWYTETLGYKAGGMYSPESRMPGTLDLRAGTGGSQSVRALVDNESGIVVVCVDHPSLFMGVGDDASPYAGKVIMPCVNRESVAFISSIPDTSVEVGVTNLSTRSEHVIINPIFGRAPLKFESRAAQGSIDAYGAASWAAVSAAGIVYTRPPLIVNVIGKARPYPTKINFKDTNKETV